MNARYSFRVVSCIKRRRRMFFLPEGTTLSVFLCLCMCGRFTSHSNVWNQTEHSFNSSSLLPQGASALRPAAALVAVRSTVERSSLTIQVCGRNFTKNSFYESSCRRNSSYSPFLFTVKSKSMWKNSIYDVTFCAVNCVKGVCVPTFC